MVGSMGGSTGGKFEYMFDGELSVHISICWSLVNLCNVTQHSPTGKLGIE